MTRTPEQRRAAAVQANATRYGAGWAARVKPERNGHGRHRHKSQGELNTVLEANARDAIYGMMMQLSEGARERVWAAVERVVRRG